MVPTPFYKPKHLSRVLEGSVDVPAATLAGLVLKASGNPTQVAQQWVKRAEREAS